MQGQDEQPRRIYRQTVRFLSKKVKTDKRYVMEHPQVVGFLSVAHFDAEVRNGGLTQFFTNHSNKTYTQVVDFLNKLGAIDQLNILKLFVASLPEEVDPSNASSVGNYVFGNKCVESKIEALTAQYYELSHSFYVKMNNYSRKTNLIQKDWLA